MLELEGIRIRSPEPFGVLFSSVFPQLRRLSWLAHNDSFEPRVPDLWDRLQQALHEVSHDSPGGKELLGAWSRDELFPTYSPLVSEDWCGLFGSPDPNLDGHQWLAGYFETSDRATYVAESCSVCFLEIDGAHWEFYASERELISSTGEECSAFALTSVEPCKLQSSNGL